MKKTILFAWIFLSGMCFIACSSDDDNNNKSPVEERVHDLDIFTDRLITVDENWLTDSPTSLPRATTSLSFCTMPKERNRVRCISRRAAVPSLPR